jgi:hypothetical protein
MGGLSGATGFFFFSPPFDEGLGDFFLRPPLDDMLLLDCCGLKPLFVSSDIDILGFT